MPLRTNAVSNCEKMADYILRIRHAATTPRMTQNAARKTYNKNCNYIFRESSLERFLNCRGLVFVIPSQDGTPLAVLPSNTQCFALEERPAGRLTGGAVNSIPSITRDDDFCPQKHSRSPLSIIDAVNNIIDAINNGVPSKTKSPRIIRFAPSPLFPASNSAAFLPRQIG